MYWKGGKSWQEIKKERLCKERKDFLNKNGSNITKNNEEEGKIKEFIMDWTYF
jgi:hypothetical protein